MQAAVLHAIGDLRIEEIATPSPGPGEVLVRIGSCGICGSDVPRVFTKGTYSFPTVCGHEFAGTVAATGPGATLAVGTQVTVFPLLWCGRCAECERGEYARCADYDYLGSRSDGGFAQFVVAPQRNCLALLAGVSVEEGAMTEPAAVALHAVKRSGLKAGETVAVFGAGPIGLLVAQWARALGAARVLIFDIAPRNLELARELGFSEVFDSKAGDPVARVEATTGGRGADVTLEAAGVPATFTAAVASAAAGGRVVMLGNPSGDVVLPAKLISQMMRRELALVGTWNSSFSACGLPDDWRTVLAAVAAGTIRLKPLVTHRFGLKDTMAGMQVMKNRTEFVSKVLINP
ncbi:MAG TPA: galactitol-1-phosphate 5-dehydrogenase [Planctomycetes bacterium]|nr:galactitol-1-phosphate 5-dehydrogenase [Planctomycetota bacterium]